MTPSAASRWPCAWRHFAQSADRSSIPGEPRFVVLDGANRVTALTSLGIPHVVLPAGITRHVILRRALRLDFPLAVLRDDWPLIEKNGYLKDWLRRKIANKEARFYQESTFLFDE